MRFIFYINVDIDFKKSVFLSVISKFLILLKDFPIMEDKTPNAPILFQIKTFILATKLFFLYFKFSHDTLINL